MGKASSKEVVSIDRFERAVKKYAVEQANYQHSKRRFEAVKEKCSNIMGKFFESKKVNSIVVNNVAFGDEVAELDSNVLATGVTSVKVNRVQRIKVSFDADKLQKALSKEHAERVITKRYEVKDMPALIAYMKALGANPAKFKALIQVSKSVNESELERLEELGEITQSQLDGCYTVSKEKPYFTVKAVGGSEE